MIWECTADGILLMVETITTDAIPLDSTSTYIINPGSVGQPRNGDPASSYILLDDVEQTIAYRGVPYDILAAQDKIYDAMLPMPLAERLEIGR
jgi:diadenosine tetraphosphatase ApaH/serine/threonine PP2A family protein phosphatase